jgi:hypothetical protein
MTLPQARALFAQYRQVEIELPTDNNAATLTNLLDAIFYMRFGGQWRATAAPHAFHPMPIAPHTRKPLPTAPPVAEQLSSKIVRHISRAIFSE